MPVTVFKFLDGRIITKGGKIATKCCCKPYVIASVELEDDSTWDLRPYAGAGIAKNGGDAWRICEKRWGWSLRSGCVKDDGTLDGIGTEFNNGVPEGTELPVMYGGTFEIQAGCYRIGEHGQDSLTWPE